MDNNIKDLEKTFLNNLDSKGKEFEAFTAVFIGARGSGKSTLALNLIKHYYNNDVFQQYHIIVPSFKTVNGQKQYGFMKEMDKNKCFIYNGFHSKILQTIRKKKESDHYLFFYDDSTAHGKDLSKDPNFLEFIFQGRNERITILLTLHAARRVMASEIRTNFDYIFCFRMNNRKLREAMFEEYFNLYFPDFRSFEFEFKNAIMNTSERHNVWLFAPNSGFDPYVSKWNIQQNPPELMKKPQKRQIKHTENTENKTYKNSENLNKNSENLKIRHSKFPNFFLK